MWGSRRVLSICRPSCTQHRSCSGAAPVPSAMRATLHPQPSCRRIVDRCGSGSSRIDARTNSMSAEPFSATVGCHGSAGTRCRPFESNSGSSDRSESVFTGVLYIFGAVRQCDCPPVMGTAQSSRLFPCAHQRVTHGSPSSSPPKPSPQTGSSRRCRQLGPSVRT